MIKGPIDPMLALRVDELPLGDLAYEPKWDGFRAIVEKDGDDIAIWSRNRRPLARYFPELVSGLADAGLPKRCVLDGELVIAGAGGLDFEALLQRIHPAPSRIARLATQTPASFVAFDLLALGERDLRGTAFGKRRDALEKALRKARPPVHLTPLTTDPARASDWFHRFEGAGLDGVIAKPLDLPYVEGERVMFKLKHRRTADCVIGGYRVGRDGKGLASLLLGLYDADGVLHHVGVASGLPAAERTRLEKLLAPLKKGASKAHPWLGGDVHADTQRVPDTESRWTGARKLDWIAVRPELVAEVAFDHMQGTRFRHATRLVHLRPDRDAASCTYAQLESVAPLELHSVFGTQR